MFWKLYSKQCVCLVDGFNGLSTKQTPLYANKELIHPLVFPVWLYKTEVALVVLWQKHFLNWSQMIVIVIGNALNLQVSTKLPNFNWNLCKYVEIKYELCILPAGMSLNTQGMIMEPMEFRAQQYKRPWSVVPSFGT